ncbi:DNA-3-methyladenine glycosylase family protein [Goodfellowiella coeruleoviolacea]|uniref:3-methyladenine DNA glycosylase/8-oxoguanine DNA glycosylase n=1 Tax=Goodfellowiella coeruleoviolacea TaxID=334858 RepID=A0AAE3KKC8_9PSEU|nr:DNA-3-methyladenine glycosylase 2 family protein [Goodfellowiella coeruleoviolacea]MCP2170032.1 3-methyladenine DNA glycosylase/8-oxoguanine DNA glycosylase [Goodfellowiella coeruleoviolacea]
MTAGVTRASTRCWRPPFPLDLAAVLAPLRRGRGDPTHQLAEDGAHWLTANTPAGPGTLAVRRAGAGEVRAAAWGAGAEWLLAGVPALLGADDDDSGFQAHHPLVADTRRRLPGLRLGATGRVWDALVPAVLEQKVTGYEARRSWRELCRRFGLPAPGPAVGMPAGMRVPPTPAALLAVPDWEWHRAGVDGGRRRALVASAQVASRLERAATLRGAAGRRLLCLVPGIGVWTAAEVAQRAWGDPDAVSVGDFHIPSVVGWALVGRPLDDEGMLRVLAPYTPQRQRAVRYVEASGFRRPRYGPRYAGRDYRAI